jgi:hypothetical protein
MPTADFRGTFAAPNFCIIAEPPSNFNGETPKMWKTSAGDRALA